MASDEFSDLPFRGEYAKSGRAGCKMCKDKIDKGELRLAVMVQSPMFDGKTPNWYHTKCFFIRNRPKTVGDISHFDSLRWEDQEKVRTMVESALKGGSVVGKSSNKKAASGPAGGLSANGTILKDFRLEYAKSGASKCGVCEEKITKGEVRAGKKEFDSERAKRYGPYDRWHHIDCFVGKQEELEYFDAGSVMAGFMTLSPQDQELVKSKIKAVKGKADSSKRSHSANGNDGADEPDAKKVKVEGESQADKTKEMLKKQLKKIYYYRDNLERSLKKSELQDLLEMNGQQVPSGVDKMLDRLADCMTFGALEPCTECSGGQLVFRSGVGYQCLGDMSEWTKCQHNTLEPKRKPFKVSSAFKSEFDFMKMYKGKVGQRIVPQNSPSAKKSSNGDKNGEDKSKALAGARFVIDKSSVGDKDSQKMKEKIERYGGRVDSKVGSSTAAVIGSRDVMEQKFSKVVTSAKDNDIQVVASSVIDNIFEQDLVSLIKKHTLSPWGSDPKGRVKLASSSSSNGLKSSSSMYSKEMPKSVRMKLKGGGCVDPESGLEDKAHVLKGKESALYSVVLGAVNIQEGKNSFYKLQVLQHDKKHKWYVFRSWGRVGTTIGNKKLEDFEDKSEAVRQFEYLYEDKTGNRWRDRASFRKVAGKFYPLELDYGQPEESVAKRLELADSRSRLDRAVQELVALIFDIDNMKRAMVEFDIDLAKMPLGKLSRGQIERAYSILTEVQTMLADGSGSESRFLDASNRFFTLIPHDFGMRSPPVLDNADYVKTKVEMLDSLLDIEVAYSLMKAPAGDDKGKDPIDAHYDKLKTEIDVVDKSTDEFKMIDKYVKNTHASTHNLYTLAIDQVFRVSRKGESKRFKPFKQLHNRQLLWHGSRTTNYAGILSQGLRIAPPEAPVTGYMFGKGVYFADMVSKSANYCNTTRSNNTGLLLLCDVALGNTLERTSADYIKKLPTGMHSTMGVGKTMPDPEEMLKLEDGCSVPLGKPIKKELGPEGSDLLYNEFIVYDVAQVQCKYLLKLKFDYKF